MYLSLYHWQNSILNYSLHLIQLLVGLKCVRYFAKSINPEGDSLKMKVLLPHLEALPVKMISSISVVWIIEHILTIP